MRFWSVQSQGSLPNPGLESNLVDCGLRIVSLTGIVEVVVIYRALSYKIWLALKVLLNGRVRFHSDVESLHDNLSWCQRDPLTE